MSNQFYDEFPFDEVMDHPTMTDPGVQALSNFIGDYPSRAPATQGGYKKFCKLLLDVHAPWKEDLESFVKRMNEGAYADDFGKFANLSETGHIPPGVVSVFGCYECSQVSELFSQFCQALHYNEDLDDEEEEDGTRVGQ